MPTYGTTTRSTTRKGFTSNLRGEYPNKVAGSTRSAVGRATGNRRLQARGAAQKAKGKAIGAGRRLKQAGRDVKGTVRNATRRARPLGNSGNRQRPMRPSIGRKPGRAKVTTRRY